jgi:hypothetical protein
MSTGSRTTSSIRCENCKHYDPVHIMREGLCLVRLYKRDPKIDFWVKHSDSCDKFEQLEEEANGYQNRRK